MNDIITMNQIVTVTPAFKSQKLQKATESIIKIYTSAAQYADSKNREIAKILATVAAEQSYKEDGFDSVADYAEKTFSIKRANAYALSSAGAVYNDPKADERLKDLSPSKLAEVVRMPADKVKENLDSGLITPATSQKELREIAKAAKEEPGKVEILKNYIAIPMDPRFEEFAKAQAPTTLEHWGTLFDKCMREWYGATYFEEIKLPKGRLNPAAEKATYNRMLYATDKTSVVVFFETPKERPAPAQKRKFTRAELEAMLKECEE